MSDIEPIKQHFADSIISLQKGQELLAPDIARAAEAMVKSLLNSGTIFSCGNGGAACNAQYFASQLLNRFQRQRPALPAIALSTNVATMTAIGEDSSYDEIFAKQLRALAQDGDILLAITRQEQAVNVCQAIKVAQQKQVTVVALNGGDGGEMTTLLGKGDIEIRIPSSEDIRIQELQSVVIHALCATIDRRLFGDNS